MEKKNQNNKNEASEQTTLKSDFGKFVPTIFDLPTLDKLLGSDDKKDVILAKITFQDTTWGEQAIILLADGKEYHTGSEVVIKKLHIAEQNGIKYPIRAYILRKGQGTLTYFDIV